MYKLLLANAQTHKNLNKKMNTVAFIISFVLLAVLLYKAIFSMSAIPDESFYITIPHRILKGDSLFVDDWHASQISSFLQYPFVLVYTYLMGSTEGIVLFMRLIYAVIQLGTGLFIYFKLKNNSYIAAIMAMVLFCLYFPETIMQLDYYTESLVCAELIALLLFTTNKRGFLRCFFVGVLIAFSVTAQPFDSLVYFAYSLAVLVYCLYKKLTKKAFEPLNEHLSPKLWLYISAGIVTVFAVFMAFLLKNASFSDVFRSLPNIFSGEEHALLTQPEEDLFFYDRMIQALYGLNNVIFPLDIAVAVVLILDKKRSERKNAWAIICSVLFAVYSVCITISVKDNMQALLFRPFPLFVYGIEAYILTSNKNKKLFLFWATGLAYMLCLGIASNAFYISGVIGCVISNTAGLIMAFELLRDAYERKENALSAKINKKVSARKRRKIHSDQKISKAVSVIIAVSIAVGVCVEVVKGLASPLVENKGYIEEFGFNDSDEQLVRLDKGPLSGIYELKEKAIVYEGMLRDLDYIKSHCNGKVLVCDLTPWCYLYIDRPYATFTPWYIIEELNSYEQYFESTGNFPECIYIPYNDYYYNNEATDDDCEEAIAYFTQLLNCTIEDGEYRYILSVNR